MGFASRSSTILALVSTLTGCGGAGDLDLCESPRFNSSPPTSASAERQYLYITDARYQCGAPIVPLLCSNVVGVNLPPGAAVNVDVVYWTPPVSATNGNVQFQIATPQDWCGDSASQSWSVHVESSAIQSLTATPVAPGETTMVTAVFSGTGQILNHGDIVSGVPKSLGPIFIPTTYTLVVQGLWRRSITIKVLPTVTSTVPADGETQAPVNSALIAAFNEVMDGATVTPATFLLKDGSGNPVVGGVTYANGYAVFRPVSPLVQASSYAATITTGVRDTSGDPLVRDRTWSFVAGPADASAPSVVSTSPANGESLFPDGVRLTAEFSEIIDPSSVGASSFVLTDSSLSSVSGSRSVAGGGNSAEFVAENALAPHSTYTATVTMGLKDLAGNALPGDYSWTFVTREGPWQPTSTTNGPEGRYGSAGVWTGSEMIIWGGGGFKTGSRYNPVTDYWSPTSTTGAPASVSEDVAVWTGTEMIVWGNGGARYDPASDAWTPVTTAGEPAQRARHTLIWTEMIVWGGDSGAGALQSGARYYPAGDFWAPMSTVGAPSARYYHSAVWTGAELIVWGGGPSAVNTGAKYDPVADTWTPVSTIGAPTARTRHTAVWTGSEMIVWGGRGPSGELLMSGARYNPISDSWTPVSTTNSPTARYLHSAVWTGSEMVVWGGTDGGTSWPTAGGRYDPVSDGWQQTTTSGAPVGRGLHVAVWTGSEMIVWGGGVIGRRAFNSGGRYRP